MSECNKKGCTRDPVGTVTWAAGTELGYCQKCIRDTRAEFPNLVAEVDLA